MKKNILLALGIFSVIVLTSGCMSAYVPNGGYSAAYPAVIYTNETHPSFIGEKVENLSGIEILGDVKGSASASNVLLIVTLGDNSIEKAKADALRKIAGADDIINVEIDTQTHSILGIFTTVTTTINGKAIKYKKY